MTEVNQLAVVSALLWFLLGGIIGYMVGRVMK
jgi:hypothetical protein